MFDIDEVIERTIGILKVLNLLLIGVILGVIVSEVIK